MATQEILLPDIGDFKGVEVIEVMVNVGDHVEAEQSLLTLESDKAAMEVPSPAAGTVKELKINVGDKVSEGDLILIMEADEAGAAAPAPAPEQEKAPEPTPAPAPKAEAPEAEVPKAETPKPSPAAPAPTPAPAAAGPVDEEAFRRAHASPSVRRFARELGVDLGRVQGSGAKNRILKEDVQNFVKAALARPAAGGAGLGFDLPEMPDVDYSQFGPVETKELGRIRKLSAGYLHRNWLTIPHITLFEEADITEMEAFRKAGKAEAEKLGIKVTPLAFILKACAAALKAFPEVNASLAADGQSLVLKGYVHVGFAVDTPNGLMVPVIRDADQKGIYQIAEEILTLAKKARDGKIGPADMSGGCFTVSSLGGIGCTQFTPIVNAPEVAILGVSKAEMKPKWNGKEFEPRLTLPLALSADHRVVDGALGARFVRTIADHLSDLRRLVM